MTGGAEDSYWRGAGQRTVTGGAEDSHWRGGGQLLEVRRTVTGMTDVPQGHRRGGGGGGYKGQSLGTHEILPQDQGIKKHCLLGAASEHCNC